MNSRDSIVCICLAVSLAACNVGSFSQTPSVPPEPILFVGNSYTFINGGLDEALKGLAPDTTASRIAVGGYTLENNWSNPDTIKTLHTGRWNYVVLQEQSQMPISDPAKFYQYAENFNREARNSGAETVLLMTWERPDSVSYGVTTAALANAYNSVGARLGAKVAPAGLAFAEALKENPQVILYSQDGHPTVEGTYLAACILYETIFGRSPFGNSFSDPNIPRDVRTFLQEVAAEFIGH